MKKKGPFQKGLPNFPSLYPPDIWADKLDTETAIINQAIRRRRIRQPHSTSNMKPLPGAENLLSFSERTTQLYFQYQTSAWSRGSFVLSSKDYPTLFLYLILTLEKTNQTEYLKPKNMSTAIINQAIRRSRIRQSHSASNMKSLPGAEGLLSFWERTTQLSFFISSWRWRRQTRQSISNKIICQLPLLIKQSGEVELDNPILLQHGTFAWRSSCAVSSLTIQSPNCHYQPSNLEK